MRKRKTVADLLREAAHRWIDSLSVNQLAILLPASALQGEKPANTPPPAEGDGRKQRKRRRKKRK